MRRDRINHAIHLHSHGIPARCSHVGKVMVFTRAHRYSSEQLPAFIIVAPTARTESETKVLAQDVRTESVGEFFAAIERNDRLMPLLSVNVRRENQPRGGSPTLGISDGIHRHLIAPVAPQFT